MIAEGITYLVLIPSHQTSSICTRLFLMFLCCFQSNPNKTNKWAIPTPPLPPKKKKTLFKRKKLSSNRWDFTKCLPQKGDTLEMENHSSWITYITVMPLNFCECMCLFSAKIATIFFTQEMSAWTSILPTTSLQQMACSQLVNSSNNVKPLLLLSSQLYNHTFTSRQKTQE